MFIAQRSFLTLPRSCVCVLQHTQEIAMQVTYLDLSAEAMFILFNVLEA